MPDAPLILREVCIDPKWHVGKSSVGYFLRIEHPRHGNVDCILTLESLRAMTAALIKAAPDA